MQIDITAEEATALEIAIKQFDIDDPNDDFLLGMISLRKKVREAWAPDSTSTSIFTAAVRALFPQKVDSAEAMINGNTLGPIPTGMVGFQSKPVPDGTNTAPDATSAS